MENMNSTQGTILGRSLLTESIEEIQEALNSYKVIKVERMETMKDGIRSPNGLHVITFGTRTLPESVMCGYERFSTCCQYGHTKNWCKSNNGPVCKDCAEPKHEGICEKPKRCVNCKPPRNAHSSFDKNCKTRVVKNIIIRIKVDECISYGIARKIFDSKIQNAKQSCAEMATKCGENFAREQINEGTSIKEKREHAENILQAVETEKKAIGNNREISKSKK
jgi:hypothetical protein